MILKALRVVCVLTLIRITVAYTVTGNGTNLNKLAHQKQQHLYRVVDDVSVDFSAVGISNGKANNGTHLPIVLWHGMGDNCCNDFSMGAFKKTLETKLGNKVYVKSLMIGDSAMADTNNGFFMNVNSQVNLACKLIQEDPLLKEGFNAIGFSQGCQFMRGYIQRCNNPKVHNFISIGGQHQGIAQLPHCDIPGVCSVVRRMISWGVNTKFVQNHLVQAQYWHDPTEEIKYKQYNTYLADLNNEYDIKNSTYKENLKSLNKFVMIKFNQDGMVVPIESEWFGYYAPNQTPSAQTILPMRETQLYKEDWLGLQEMDNNHQLVFYAVDGDHLQFNESFLNEKIIPYLL